MLFFLKKIQNMHSMNSTYMSFSLEGDISFIYSRSLHCVVVRTVKDTNTKLSTMIVDFIEGLYSDFFSSDDTENGLRVVS